MRSFTVFSACWSGWGALSLETPDRRVLVPHPGYSCCSSHPFPSGPFRSCSPRSVRQCLDTKWPPVIRTRGGGREPDPAQRCGPPGAGLCSTSDPIPVGGRCCGVARVWPGYGPPARPEPPLVTQDAPPIVPRTDPGYIPCSRGREREAFRH